MRVSRAARCPRCENRVPTRTRDEQRGANGTRRCQAKAEKKTQSDKKPAERVSRRARPRRTGPRRGSGARPPFSSPPHGRTPPLPRAPPVASFSADPPPPPTEGTRGFARAGRGPCRMIPDTPYRHQGGAQFLLAMALLRSPACGPGSCRTSRYQTVTDHGRIVERLRARQRGVKMSHKNLNPPHLAVIVQRLWQKCFRGASRATSGFLVSACRRLILSWPP